ncbi:hypothetical protein [Microvirga sp. P5_D2]
MHLLFSQPCSGFATEPTEKPYILLVVGYPAASCTVPVYGGIKKPLEKIASWL